uniref:GAG-pre-integrase domain-containing protein n=1 Tax=Triticum urartu TaxID=4572 RepID=A0A8R7UZN3_TRIUA
MIATMATSKFMQQMEQDQVTCKVLLHAQSRGGLYPLQSKPLIHGWQAFSASKPSSSRWHRRLGHPSYVVVDKVLKENRLPFSSKNNESVCDACQKAKSHQLPYPSSTSVPSAPLELIFSDVWGPA